MSNWYITVKGGGTFTTSDGRVFQGGPNEASDEQAREAAESGLDWLIVSDRPVSLTEAVLTGPLVISDFRRAEAEAAKASEDNAPAARGGDGIGGGADNVTPPAESEDDKEEVLRETETETEDGRVPCPHCDRTYASEASRDRHVSTAHADDGGSE